MNLNTRPLMLLLIMMVVMMVPEQVLMAGDYQHPSTPRIYLCEVIFLNYWLEVFIFNNSLPLFAQSSLARFSISII